MKARWWKDKDERPPSGEATTASCLPVDVAVQQGRKPDMLVAVECKNGCHAAPGVWFIAFSQAGQTIHVIPLPAPPCWRSSVRRAAVPAMLGIMTSNHRPIEAGALSIGPQVL